MTRAQQEQCDQKSAPPDYVTSEPTFLFYFYFVCKSRVFKSIFLPHSVKMNFDGCCRVFSIIHVFVFYILFIFVCHQSALPLYWAPENLISPPGQTTSL